MKQIGISCLVTGLLLLGLGLGAHYTINIMFLMCSGSGIYLIGIGTIVYKAQRQIVYLVGFANVTIGILSFCTGMFEWGPFWDCHEVFLMSFGAGASLVGLGLIIYGSSLTQEEPNVLNDIDLSLIKTKKRSNKKSIFDSDRRIGGR